MHIFPIRQFAALSGMILSRKNFLEILVTNLPFVRLTYESRGQASVCKLIMPDLTTDQSLFLIAGKVR